MISFLTGQCHLIFRLLYLTCSKQKYFQWRIQDFPECGANPRGENSRLSFDKHFAQNCMKIKELGPIGDVGSLCPLGSANSNVRKHFLSIWELIFMPWTGRECTKISPTIRGWESVYKWLPKFDQSTWILQLFSTFGISHSRTKSDSEHC